MKHLTKAAIALVAATALVISGASIASALGSSSGGKPPLVPQSVRDAAANAHTNAVGPSPRLPARTEARQVTITPCTLFDTSKKGGKILGNHSRMILTRGTGSLAAQGGSSTGCGVPEAATSLNVTLTVSSATSASGHLNWQPTGSSKATRVISYTKNQTATTGSYLQLAATDPAGKFTNAGGSVNLQVTVVGYSIPPIEGMVANDGSIYSGSTRILSASVLSPGVYKVTVDSDVSYCTPTVTTYSGAGVYGSAYAFAGTSIYVYTWYISNSTHVEVPNSYYFYLTVDC